MGWRTNRNAVRALEAENLRWPERLKEVPREAWPAGQQQVKNLLRVLRSRRFLVQVFTAQSPAVVRLSVNRTSLVDGRWADGISWDELQRLKAEAGYAEHWAVEIYPNEPEVVNVANIRHLWLLAEAPAFAWRRAEAA